MKTQFPFLVFLATCFLGLSLHGQSFDSKQIILSPNLAWGDMVHIPVGSANPYSTDQFGKPIKRVVPTGQLSLQAEFAIHKYWGLGFVAGVGGNPSALFREVNIPLALLANFHFLQYLADKKGKKLHSDKMDVYAGLMVGGGVAIHPYGANSLFYQTTFYDALLCIGPHIGFNYYFKNNIAFHGQAGYGVTAVQIGLTVKIKAKGK